MFLLYKQRMTKLRGGGVYGNPGRGSIFGEKFYTKAAQQSRATVVRSRSRSRSVSSSRSRPSVSASKKSRKRSRRTRKSASR